MADKRNLKSEYVQLATKIVIWILGSILIYWLILKLTGHSPTMDQLILIGEGLIIGFLFKLQRDIHENRIEIKINRIKIKNIDRNFIALAKDFKECKRRYQT